MESRNLAQIVIERTSVSLYYHGESEPERLDLDEVSRILISLRDVDGPCVWVEAAAAAPAPESPTPEPDPDR